MNVDEMIRISGSASRDLERAEHFCREATDEIAKRAEQIERIYNLDPVLDARQLVIASECRAGIRHIMVVLQEIAMYHDKSTLRIPFRKTIEANVGVLNRAQTNYAALSDMLYSQKDYEVRADMRS